MRRPYLFAAALLLAATPLFAQRDFSKVEVKAEKVAGTAYMLTGAGGNIGLSIGDDGVVMIDDQYAPMAPKIRAAIKSITDKPLRFVINTHWHGDHTGGNESFGGEAPLIAHENARKRLASGGKGKWGEVPPAPKAALQAVTFDSALTVHLNGEDVRAVHFPAGHTDGDAVIWFTQSNVVHMGDDYFNGMFPFVDLDSGGSVRGVVANGEKILKMLPDDVKIIPGHGPLSNKAGLRAYLDALKGALGAVEKGVKAKKTLEQLKAEKVLSPWEAWGKGFISQDIMTEIIFTELTAKKQ